MQKTEKKEKTTKTTHKIAKQFFSSTVKQPAVLYCKYIMKSVTQTKKVKVNVFVIPVFMLSFHLPFKMPNTCLDLLHIKNDRQSLIRPGTGTVLQHFLLSQHFNQLLMLPYEGKKKSTRSLLAQCTQFLSLTS